MDGDGSGAAMAPGESREAGQECCPSQAKPEEAVSSQAWLWKDSRQLLGAIEQEHHRLEAVEGEGQLR